MSLPIKTGFPDGHTLSPGYIVKFRATDPTTGADVSGVKVSLASVFSDTGGTLALQPVGNETPVLLLPIGGEAIVGAVAGAVLGAAV